MRLLNIKYYEFIKYYIQGVSDLPNQPLMTDF